MVAIMIIRPPSLRIYITLYCPPPVSSPYFTLLLLQFLLCDKEGGREGEEEAEEEGE